MSKQGQLLLTQRERDRLVALRKADKKLITQKQAAQQTGLSERHLRRLLAKLRSEGDQAVVHAVRGRASNRKLSAKAEKQAVAILSQPVYAGFGPTLAAEYLEQRHGVQVGRETLRRWMAAAGLWKPRRRKSGRPHPWRPRRSCRGELVQWDTSEHDWLEGRGEKLYLIGMIDDASSELLARFVRHDSGEENRRLLKTYLEQNGRPVAFYTDRASLFVNTPKNSAGEDPKLLPPTQIGRALQELDIESITAYSPQAKGRVERSFGTAQDRLVKGLRVAGATNDRTGQRLPGKRVSALVERHVAGAAGSPRRGASRARSRARSGLGAEPRRDAAGRQRLHDSLPGKELSNRPQGDCAGSAKQPSAGGECVQSRLACSVGDSPTGVEVRAP